MGSISDRKFKNKANDFEWFSLALDESEKNVISTAQVFMLVGAKFEEPEVLASVRSWLRTTTDENVFLGRGLTNSL